MPLPPSASSSQRSSAAGTTSGPHPGHTTRTLMSLCIVVPPFLKQWLYILEPLARSSHSAIGRKGSSSGETSEPGQGERGRDEGEGEGRPQEPCGQVLALLDRDDRPA